MFFCLTAGCMGLSEGAVAPEPQSSTAVSRLGRI